MNRANNCNLIIINGGRAEPETEAIGRITVLAARATLEVNQRKRSGRAEI